MGVCCKCRFERLTRVTVFFFPQVVSLVREWYKKKAALFASDVGT